MPRILCTTVSPLRKTPPYATGKRHTCCVSVWAATPNGAPLRHWWAPVVGEHGAGACYPPSSSSSAFASWRSALSKPSVNQP
jgi:hypothetical protein